MNSYLVSTLSVITLLSFLEIIVSKTSNGKAVKTVISLICTFMLIVPVVSILKGENNYNEALVSENSYYKHLEVLQESAVLQNVKFALNKGDFKYFDTSVEYEFNGDIKSISKIKIILDKGVIISQDERINMIKEVKTLLSEVVDVEEVEIEIETY